MLPSNLPGVPRTTWRKPGYLCELGSLPIALGTPQPLSRWIALSHTRTSTTVDCTLGVSRRARWLLIMVAVLRRDLLPPTANSELPKNRSTVPGFRQRLFQDATIGVAENNDRSRNSEALAALYPHG